jgi:hypothetical protein
MSTRYDRMFHAFQMYVVYVLFGCYICCNVYTRILQAYISNISVVFKRMLQVIYLDVACVALAMHVSCRCTFSNISAVSNVCCKCFISMLHMLQWPYTYAASVCF